MCTHCGQLRVLSCVCCSEGCTVFSDSWPFSGPPVRRQVSHGTWEGQVFWDCFCRCTNLRWLSLSCTWALLSRRLVQGFNQTLPWFCLHSGSGLLYDFSWGNVKERLFTLDRAAVGQRNDFTQDQHGGVWWSRYRSTGDKSPSHVSAASSYINLPPPIYSRPLKIPGS